MKEFMVLGGFVLSYIVICIVAWKLFDFFNTTLLGLIDTTGFRYYLKKFMMSCVVIPAIVYFIAIMAGWVAFTDTSKDSKTSTQSSQSKEYKQSSNTSTSSSSKSSNTTPVYSKEQVMEMENKVDYHGDDPLIRNRLGLPPTPASQY